MVPNVILPRAPNCELRKPKLRTPKFPSLLYIISPYKFVIPPYNTLTPEKSPRFAPPAVPAEALYSPHKLLVQ